MKKVEDDIKNHFLNLREEKSKEIYFYNPSLFNDYVGFIKSHPLFIKEIFTKPPKYKEIVKIVQKNKPTLQERGVSRRDVLKKARAAENDEFYTRYEDVEKEISMYSQNIWKDKVIFCNCDDAVGEDDKNTSAFALFFIKNFHKLAIKKLICTHFSGKIDLFNAGTKGYIFTKNGFQEIKEYPKGYTGSFDDPISLNILNNEADIVCTNPPFSIAQEYWKTVINSGKKFLIISNITSIILTSYIPYFKNNKVWAGYNRVDKYLSPKQELVDAGGHWYTNLPINNRPKYKNLKIIPLENIPEKYKRYDDNGILLVDRGYVPSNYNDVIAVSARPLLNGVLEKGYCIVSDKTYPPFINGKGKFARVLIQKK